MNSKRREKNLKSSKRIENLKSSKRIEKNFKNSKKKKSKYLLTMKRLNQRTIH